MEQFTTLARLKTWLSITTTDNDAQLGPLIGQVTEQILDYIGRETFLLTNQVLTTNGRNAIAMTLPEWPVQNVSALSINGNPISYVAAPGCTPGFAFDAPGLRPPGGPQRLYLRGYTFCRGVQNVTISYQTGYAVLLEKNQVAATVTVKQHNGKFARDEGVLDATGIAMVCVTSAPTVGQYSVNAETGTYTFNASQTGVLSFSYSYVPSAIEKVCIDICQRRYLERNRIAQKSVSVGGETTTTYDLSAMPEDAKMALQSYKKVFQPC